MKTKAKVHWAQNALALNLNNSISKSVVYYTVYKVHLESLPNLMFNTVICNLMHVY